MHEVCVLPVEVFTFPNRARGVRLKSHAPVAQNTHRVSDLARCGLKDKCLNFGDFLNPHELKHTHCVTFTPEPSLDRIFFFSFRELQTPGEQV